MRWWTLICTILMAPVLAHAGGNNSGVVIEQKPGCLIKGNVGNKKVKLYHLPNSPSYAKTKISKRGERWFCSEEEAKAAGWQKAHGFRRGIAVHDQQDFKVPTEDHPKGCTIKGNVSSYKIPRIGKRQIKIYHVIGSPRYAETAMRSQVNIPRQSRGL